jgi:hypothetical protein
MPTSFRALVPVDVEGTADPYCQLTLISTNREHIEKHKTAAIERTLAPQWEEK